jgi:hypothetical protein
VGAVATLAATVGLGCHLVCAALLHDLPNEPGYDPVPLRAEFGDDVVSLIEELDAYGPAVPEDDRVMALKLLDRLHNMRTIEYLDEDKQVLRSRHTLDLLVPHAQRLGRDLIADELQTLARHRLRTLAGTVDGVERPWHVLWLGSFLLPPGARRRYLEEWSAELQFLPDHRRTAFIRELVRGLPRLCVALRSSGWRDSRPAAGLRRAPSGDGRPEPRGPGDVALAPAFEGPPVGVPGPGRRVDHPPDRAGRPRRRPGRPDHHPPGPRRRHQPPTRPPRPDHHPPRGRRQTADLKGPGNGAVRCGWHFVIGSASEGF